MKVAVLAVLSLCTAACAWEAPVVPELNKVLLISVDTLRADYLGVYNPIMGADGLATSPNVDELAEGSFVFTDAVAQSTSTLPSHTALFYSLHTFVHEAYTTNPPDPLLTPPMEALQAAGFTTGALVGGGQLRPNFQFDRGFDVYEVITTTFVPGRPPRDDRLKKLRARTARFLRRNCEQRCFLFVHLYTPHYPYYPPEEYLSRYREKVERLDTASIDPTVPLVPTAEGGAPDPADYLATERRLKYAASVRYADDFIGDLLRRIEGLGLDDLAIVFLSDHGDSHGERGRDGHGTFYEEVLRVPLIIRIPDLEGRRIDAPVELNDVMPTLFSLLGEEPPYPFMGRDLVPLLQGTEDVIEPDRVRFSENQNTRTGESTVAVVHGDWKLIFSLQNRHDLELYNTVEDPGEVHNLAFRNMELVTELRGHYRRLVDEGEALRALFRRSDDGHEGLDQETLRELRALGYIE